MVPYCRGSSKIQTQNNFSFTWRMTQLSKRRGYLILSTFLALLDVCKGWCKVCTRVPLLLLQDLCWNSFEWTLFCWMVRFKKTHNDSNRVELFKLSNSFECFRIETYKVTMFKKDGLFSCSFSRLHPFWWFLKWGNSLFSWDVMVVLMVVNLNIR